MRMAVVETNEEYQRSVDMVDQLRAVLALLNGKMDCLKMAYFSSKDIIRCQTITVGSHHIHSTMDREERMELEASPEDNGSSYGMED